jgi:Lrp/AsnC family transcriptional regulator for asnA, asnC and gidA
MKIDENTIALIKHLRDGRKSFKKIADEMSLSEATVRNRVNKLVQEGVLDICGLVDPEAMPDMKPMIIGVKLKTTDMFKKGEEFSQLKGVVSVNVVTGRYDLMLLVIFNKEYDLPEFYTEQISRVKDVHSLETFVIYKSFNLKVPCL